MLTNYKKSKNTNQSQKGYKLKKSLLFLYIIIKMLSLSKFKKVLYSKDLYECADETSSNNIFRKIFCKFNKALGIITIHHIVNGSRRHAFYVHKSVIHSDWFKQHIYISSKGEYYTARKKMFVMNGLENNSQQKLFYKIKDKTLRYEYSKLATKKVSNFLSKRYSSKDRDSSITLKSYMNSNILIKKDKDRKVAYNIFQNDKTKIYKKRRKYVFEDWKATLLKISKRIDMSRVDMRLFTEPEIYFYNKRPLTKTYGRHLAKTIDVDKRQQIRLYKSKKDLSNETLKFKSTSRVSDVSVDNNVSKLGDIFDKMCYNFTKQLRN